MNAPRDSTGTGTTAAGEPGTTGDPDGSGASGSEGTGSGDHENRHDREGASDPDRDGDADPPARDDGSGDDPGTDRPGAAGTDGTAGWPDPADDPAHEGWWRYPPAAWLGLATTLLSTPVVAAAVGGEPGVASQIRLFLATALLSGPILALVLGSLLSFGTVFWGSRHYRADPEVDWNPNPVLYLVGSVLATPLLVGGVWFVERVRHVGRPAFSTWI